MSASSQSSVLHCSCKAGHPLSLCVFTMWPIFDCSLSPMFTHADHSHSAARYVDSMFSEAFLRGHQLLRGDPKRSVHLAVGLLLRGDIVISDVARNVDKLKREIRMAHWNQDGEADAATMHS